MSCLTDEFIPTFHVEFPGMGELFDTPRTPLLMDRGQSLPLPDSIFSPSRLPLDSPVEGARGEPFSSGTDTSFSAEGSSVQNAKSFGCQLQGDMDILEFLQSTHCIPTQDELHYINQESETLTPASMQQKRSEDGSSGILAVGHDRFEIPEDLPVLPNPLWELSHIFDQEDEDASGRPGIPQHTPPADKIKRLTDIPVQNSSNSSGFHNCISISAPTLGSPTQGSGDHVSASMQGLRIMDSTDRLQAVDSHTLLIPSRIIQDEESFLLPHPSSFSEPVHVHVDSVSQGVLRSRPHSQSGENKQEMTLRGGGGVMDGVGHDSPTQTENRMVTVGFEATVPPPMPGSYGHFVVDVVDGSHFSDDHAVGLAQAIPSGSSSSSSDGGRALAAKQRRLRVLKRRHQQQHQQGEGYVISRPKDRHEGHSGARPGAGCAVDSQALMRESMRKVHSSNSLSTGGSSRSRPSAQHSPVFCRSPALRQHPAGAVAEPQFKVPQQCLQQQGWEQQQQQQEEWALGAGDQTAAELAGCMFSPGLQDPVPHYSWPSQQQLILQSDCIPSPFAPTASSGGLADTTHSSAPSHPLPAANPPSPTIHLTSMSPLILPASALHTQLQAAPYPRTPSSTSAVLPFSSYSSAPAHYAPRGSAVLPFVTRSSPPSSASPLQGVGGIPQLQPVVQSSGHSPLSHQKRRLTYLQTEAGTSPVSPHGAFPSQFSPDAQMMTSAAARIAAANHDDTATAASLGWAEGGGATGTSSVCHSRKRSAPNTPGKKGPRAKFPKEAVNVLNEWFKGHQTHPYPSEEEKRMLADQSGLLTSQVNCWFINTRMRRWHNPASKKGLQQSNQQGSGSPGSKSSSPKGSSGPTSDPSAAGSPNSANVADLDPSTPAATCPPGCPDDWDCLTSADESECNPVLLATPALAILRRELGGGEGTEEKVDTDLEHLLKDEQFYA